MIWRDVRITMILVVVCLGIAVYICMIEGITKVDGSWKKIIGRNSCRSEIDICKKTRNRSRRKKRIMIFVRFVIKRGYSLLCLVVGIGFVKSVLYKDVKRLCYVMYVIQILKDCLGRILIRICRKLIRK